jgi:hypothetical protein
MEDDFIKLKEIMDSCMAVINLLLVQILGKIK